MIHNAIGIGEGDLMFARPTSVTLSSNDSTATLYGVPRKPLAVLYADSSAQAAAAYVEDGQGNTITNYYLGGSTVLQSLTVTFNGPSHALVLVTSLLGRFYSTSVNDYLFIYR